ncbi:MAG: DUF2142 domain-containing protein [Bacilli bacterium]|nr:DUF2142 domain-containing protein [Bacilli bacterium]
MKKKHITIFVILMLITILIIGVSALKKFPYPKKYIYNQFGKVIGYINEDSTFTQKFESKLDYLDGISIKYANYTEEITSGTMLVHIYDDTNKLIYLNQFDLSKILDNETVRFNFDIQKNAAGKTYTLDLELKDLDAEKNITFYGDEEGEKFSSTGENDISGSIAIGQYGQKKGYFYTIIFAMIFMLEICAFIFMWYKNKKYVIKNKKLNNVIIAISSLLFSLLFLNTITNYYYAGRISYISAILCFPLFVLIVRNFAINVCYGKPEDVFLALAIPLGTLYCITLVPGIIPDEPYHYNEIFQFLNGNFLKTKFEVYDIPIISSYNVAKQAILSENFLPLRFVEYRVGGYSYLLYLPATIGVFVGRIFNLTTLTTLYFGCYFNLVLFLVTGYFTVKYMPFCKKLAIVYLLNPMNLHQVTSLSCDAVIITTCLLFIAYVLHIKYDKDKVDIKDTIILSVLSIFVIVSKNAYFPLILMLILIKDKFKINNKINKKTLMPILGCILLAICISTFIRFFASGSDELVVDELINGMTLPQSNISKISYLLSNPLNVIYLVLTTLYVHLPFYVTTFAGNSLGWFSIGVPIYVTIAYYVLLFLSIFMDKEKYEIQLKDKIIILLIWLLNVAVIFGGLYISWGYARDIIVEGVQGRYFIPINLLILLIIYNKKSILSFKNNTLIISLLMLLINLLTIGRIIYYFIG